ncbi:MAG TPA: PilZ domain-containing protein [Candidatus Baltobacteraceae bacterium]|nr:PilZ domain-containing protein [Candidatus Baltobacteraceae bacterium]
MNVPVKIRVRRVAEPVQATMLHIAVAGCRIRCWMALERGTAVSFDWSLDGGKVLQLSGAVAARYAARNGAVGFEYAIALEELPESDSDALAREAALLARRSAAARSYDTSIVDVSQFTGKRVPDDFPIAFRIEGGHATSSIGRACDVMGSGLRIRCDYAFRPGEIVLLQFTLPDRKELRRRFPALKVKAKVLGGVKDSRRRDSYEVQFVDVGSTVREELARYISAS